MSIFVTGGSGFIGSNFILNWIENTPGGVINLDALTYAGNPENLKPIQDSGNYEFMRGCIGDADLVSSILENKRPTAIINFAAESHVDRSIHGPSEFIQTNILGTFQLLESAKAYWQSLEGREKEDFRFLHVSTDEVYGSLSDTDPPFSETTQYQPNSPYSASKASSDHLVRAYHHTYGLPVLTTNCSNNYGPFQFPEKLIPLIIHNALSNKPLPIYGTGLNVRDWLYVTDHCNAIHVVLDSGRVGEVYNIGGNTEKTNLEVVQTLCSILDEARPKENGASYSEQIIFVEDRAGHDNRYAIDSSKIQTELNWQPTETFESGLLKTVNWYLDNDSWVENVTSGAYQEWVSLNYV